MNGHLPFTEWKSSAKDYTGLVHVKQGQFAGRGPRRRRFRRFARVRLSVSAVSAPDPTSPASLDLWRERRVLVTGARGFLGRELTALLDGAGAFVVGTTRGRSGSSHSRLSHSGIHLKHVNLGSPASVCAALQEAKPEFIFHLSGQSRPSRARLDPGETFESNLRVVCLLLDAVRVVNPAIGVVVASTIERPVDKSTRLSPYFASKACAEIVCASYATTYRLKVAIARCSHVYGPDEDQSRLVTAIVAAKLDGKPVQLQHPSRRFDLLFVDDAVTGLACAADAMDEPGLYECTLSSGSLVTGSDVAGLVDNLVDLGLGKVTDKHYIAPSRRRTKGAPARWRPNTSLARGLSRTIDWHRLHHATKAKPRHG
jgi:nucleoside-diphosphate-sugar epimerase